MYDLIQNWDGENVIVRYDRLTGAWIFIAVHSTILGPATGGTRMKPYPNQDEALLDALRLSRGMTYKFAVPGISRGGGKAVVSIPEDMKAVARAALLKRFGGLVQQLGGLFYTGPDVGTSAEDMDIISESGAPYVFCRTKEAGGGGSPGPYTALGVFTAIQVACEHYFGDASLNNRRILVQGVGSVGGNLIKHLLSAGAEIYFNDVDEERIHYYREDLGLKYVPGDMLYSTDCDVYAPCALGGVLSEQTIPQLNCSIVAGGANNQFALPEDAESLSERGILYAPDYVVNVGGAMALPGIEAEGWTPQQAQENVIKSVRYALGRIFTMAREIGITTDEAALRIAKEHLRRDS